METIIIMIVHTSEYINEIISKKIETLSTKFKFLQKKLLRKLYLERFGWLIDFKLWACSIILCIVLVLHEVTTPILFLCTIFVASKNDLLFWNIFYVSKELNFCRLKTTKSTRKQEIVVKINRSDSFLGCSYLSVVTYQSECRWR